MFGTNQKYNSLFYIFSLALVLRIITGLCLDNKIYWFDGLKYDALARNLMAGKGYTTEDGNPTSFRAPGYPFFLALNYIIFGPYLWVVRIIQSLLDSMTLVIIFLIARLVFTLHIAFISAFIYAIYPLFIYTANTFYPTTLFVFLVALVIFICFSLTRKQTIPLMALFGFILGLGILTVPTFLVFVPFISIWLIFVLKKPMLQILFYLSIMILTMIVTLSPWLIRNYYVHRKPFLIATNSGYNFWMGNNPATTATTGNSIPIPESLSQKLAQTKSESEKERLFFEDAARHIRNHKLRFIKLILLKASHFWWFYPEPTTGYKMLPLPSKILSSVSYGPILILAIAGIITSWSRKKKYISLFLLLFFSFTFFYALFLAKVRFRLPVDPYLIMLASYTLHEILERRQLKTYCQTMKYIN